MSIFGNLPELLKTPGHKKRPRSDECGLFYVPKVVLIAAVDFEMLVISCGKRSTKYGFWGAIHF
jgi:hypothetical protein